MTNNLPKTLISILVVSTGTLFVLLIAGFIFLNNKIGRISVPSQQAEVTQNVSQSGLTKSDIEGIVSQAIATLSAAPKANAVTTIPTSTSAPTANKIAFIPLGSSGSTQNTNWTDVPNAQIWLNFSGEYGQLAKAWWDAFLRVDNANGTTYARLFDVTHGIAVNGSEISVSNTTTSTDVESAGNLQFWSGRNLYRVQIKSLNSSVAFFDSGRIKISY